MKRALGVLVFCLGILIGGSIIVASFGELDYVVGNSASVHAQVPPPPICPNVAMTSGSVTSTTQLIAVNQRNIRVCKIVMNVVQGVSPVNFSLIAGTGPTCAGGTSQVTMVFTGVASSTQTYDYSVDSSVGWYAGSNVGVCLSLSGTPTGAAAQIHYGLY